MHAPFAEEIAKIAITHFADFRTIVRMGLRTAFTDHPASVDETYTEHMRFAMGMAGSLAMAAGAAFVHALVPAWCERTASTRIRGMYARINSGPRATVLNPVDDQPAAA